jgi:hypothetical protein
LTRCLRPLAGVAIIAYCVWPAVAGAQGRVIGLLDIPEIFGNGPCDKFTPVELSLFDAPRAARPIATLEVEDTRIGAGTGACSDSVHVFVRRTAGNAKPTPLPTRESGYEELAAIVLAEREDWYQLRLSDGAAWLRAPAAASFYSLEKLYLEALTYLTEHWDRRLAQSPGGALSHVPGDDSQPDVEVLRSTRVNNEVWFYVAMVTPRCTGEDEVVIRRGWVPAHTKSGQNTIWFYSRGC